eukprot:5351054-Alexandrium_andersonii.AAC.1
MLGNKIGKFPNRIIKKQPRAWADLRRRYIRLGAQFGVSVDPDAPCEPVQVCRPDWGDRRPGEEALEA